MEIENLTDEDLGALADLYRQFWGESSSLEKMRATFRRLSRDRDYIFLVAKHGKCLVGSVMGIVCEELGRNRSSALIRS